PGQGRAPVRPTCDEARAVATAPRPQGARSLRRPDALRLSGRRGYRDGRGETHMEMRARNTVSPAVLRASTSTGRTWPSAASTSSASGVATAWIVPVAFFRYSTSMPRGIQRIDGGRLASVISPATGWARWHIAIACTVPMWLVTRRRWWIRPSQRPGSSTVMRGEMLAKWGALKHTARENSHWPAGQRCMRRYRRSSGLSDIVLSFPDAGYEDGGLKARRLRRSGSGRCAAAGSVLVVVAGGAQLVHVEIVHGDGVHGDLAQLLQQLALVGADHALGHGLVQLGVELQRLDALGLERLEELALHRLGLHGARQVAVDAAAGVVLARGQEHALAQAVARLVRGHQQRGDAVVQAVAGGLGTTAQREHQRPQQPAHRADREVAQRIRQRLLDHVEAVVHAPRQQR